MWMSRTVSHMSMNEIDTPPYWITRKQQAIASAASSYASPATADPRAPNPPYPPPLPSPPSLIPLRTAAMRIGTSGPSSMTCNNAPHAWHSQNEERSLTQRCHALRCQ